MSTKALSQLDRSQLGHPKLMRMGKVSLIVSLLVVKAVGGTFIILGVARVFGAPGSLGFILSISGGGAVVCATSATLIGTIVAKVVHYKLKRIKEINEANTLFDAVRVNSPKKFAQLLEEGKGTINDVDAEGNTLVHEVARHGHTWMLFHLLKMNVGVNVVNNNNETPLHLAAREGHYHSACQLLDAGAVGTIFNNDGRNPLHEAAAHGHESVVGGILERHPELLTVQDTSGRTVFHHGAASNYNIIMFLEGKYKDNKDALAAEDGSEATPLYYAVLHGQKKTVEYLMGRVPTNGALLDKYVDVQTPEDQLDARTLRIILHNLQKWKLEYPLIQRINRSTGDENV